MLKIFDYIDECIFTYIGNKKLPPTFLWVLKFDVKLGVWLKIFKFTAGRWLFFFEVPKVSLFTGGFFPFWKPADVYSRQVSILGSKSFIFLQRILKRILNLMSSHRFFGFSVNSAVKFIFWGVGSIKFEFWWGVLIWFFFVNSAIKIHIWILVGGFNFRPATYNVPPGSSAPSLKRPKASEREARVWWDGWDGDKKCPLIFFILCVYIDKVYTYLYRYLIKNCHQLTSPPST